MLLSLFELVEDRGAVAQSGNDLFDLARLLQAVDHAALKYSA